MNQLPMFEAEKPPNHPPAPLILRLGIHHFAENHLNLVPRSISEEPRFHGCYRHELFNVAIIASEAHEILAATDAGGNFAVFLVLAANEVSAHKRVNSRGRARSRASTRFLVGAERLHFSALRTTTLNWLAHFACRAASSFAYWA